MPRHVKPFAWVCLVSALCLTAFGCGGSSKITKANADRISVGMTEEAVASILGPPTSSAEVGIPLGGLLGGEMPGGLKMPQQAKQATWQEGSKAIVVTFMDGKVLNKVFLDEAQASAPKDAAPKPGLNAEPFEQSGKFLVIADQTSMVNFPFPYALPPNVELVGNDLDSVVITETKATGFQWKGVKKPTFGGEIRWIAKGLKATRLPE